MFFHQIILQKCYEIMGSNSLLILTCPNYEGFDISEMGVNSESLDAEHINLFNPIQLKYSSKTMDSQSMKLLLRGI